MQAHTRLTLAPYAAHEEHSQGRLHSESAPKHRNEFQRDRDRIIHSSAFRRLEYKTQVFVNHEGDLFRTRLTHSLEVGQIARSIARTLNLHEDLTEAISLAHDLGHTPFGHAGQTALNQCMKSFGGFEHNLQSLRVVDKLEEKYAEFDGLNLTYETREGILKHCSANHAKTLGKIGERFLTGTQPGLEAQLANLADEIAYNNHDVDDGLRSHLLTMEQLNKVELFGREHSLVLQSYPALSERRCIHETIRRIINRQVRDVIQTSQSNLETKAYSNIDEIRNDNKPAITFSQEMLELQNELKRFLRKHLYQHYRVHRMTIKAQKIIRDMFGAYMNDPLLLPTEYSCRITEKTSSDESSAQIIADYIAGMTDRYAIDENDRLFNPRVTL